MRKTDVIILLFASLILLPACKKDDPVTGSGKFISNLHTDKSRYQPGESARIFLSLRRLDFDEITLTYRYLTSEIGAERISPSTDLVEVSWQPPADDFRAYAVEVKVY